MEAELHFFHSGNGDSILIRGGEEWALVDANLVKRRRVRARLENKLNGVRRLRFVCITHFDLDHIRGLTQFLKERFSDTDTRGVRTWRIDQVITPLMPFTLGTIHKLKEWVRSPSGKMAFFPELKEESEEMSSETNALLEMLCEMAENTGNGTVGIDTPHFPYFGSGMMLFGPPSGPVVTRMGPWRIVCLGPRDTTTQQFSQQILNGFLNSEPLDHLFSDVPANATSRVLALRHIETGKSILLTGDSTTDELEAAMRAWQCLEESADRQVGSFDGIKVSHHGAKTCHLHALYESGCNVTFTEAVTCAEDDGDHPHQDVVEHVVIHVRTHKVTGLGSNSIETVPRGVGVPLGLMRTRTTPPDEEEDVCWRIENGNLNASGGRRSRFDSSIVA